MAKTPNKMTSNNPVTAGASKSKGKAAKKRSKSGASTKPNFRTYIHRVLKQVRNSCVCTSIRYTLTVYSGSQNPCGHQECLSTIDFATEYFTHKTLTCVATCLCLVVHPSTGLPQHGYWKKCHEHHE